MRKAGLLEAVKHGTAMALDVHPSDEFHRGHLKGAINIPLADLEIRLAGLPRNKEIIVYCRGPYCVWSFEAVATLRKKG